MYKKGECVNVVRGRPERSAAPFHFCIRRRTDVGVNFPSCLLRLFRAFNSEYRFWYIKIRVFRYLARSVSRTPPLTQKHQKHLTTVQFLAPTCVPNENRDNFETAWQDVQVADAVLMAMARWKQLFLDAHVVLIPDCFKVYTLDIPSSVCMAGTEHSSLSVRRNVSL